ncbi:hypothetical protein [Natrialba asiatica]|uniref:Uncharacterized protein n=1 Tax=Natrialba asiatica (strain ATCC 700177 / DSM 12278 / JCM 9576 / FERM P-10747 / NBRC 102637 / 172P1) TaxID=29540 RepID=M0AF29_NATA1|nr:hypothetical protein [Natrialba asiatica]ELY97365.1 hypothetical protein C481_19971 [Natrialba asiatica DSM 12278]
MSNDTIELELLGNATVVQTDGEPPMAAPQTVTFSAPSKSDHVAVLRADPDVSFIHVFPQDDDPKEIDSGLVTTTTVDGKSRSECWVSASALENADRLSIDTQSGQDLEAVSIDVEYRGWKARLQKRVREWKQNRRANKALARR